MGLHHINTCYMLAKATKSSSPYLVFSHSKHWLSNLFVCSKLFPIYFPLFMFTTSLKQIWFLSCGINVFTVLKTQQTGIARRFSVHLINIIHLTRIFLKHMFAWRSDKKTYHFVNCFLIMPQQTISQPDNFCFWFIAIIAVHHTLQRASSKPNSNRLH